MSLASVKKLLLMNDLKEFVVSGSWEASLEGWSGAGFTRQNALAHTGAWSIRGTDLNHFNLTLPQQTVRGLRLTFSVWVMSNGGSQTTDLQVAFGGGSFQTIFSQSVGLGYRQISGTIQAPLSGDATFRILKGSLGSIQIDDWSITGVRP